MKALVRNRNVAIVFLIIVISIVFLRRIGIFTSDTGTGPGYATRWNPNKVVDVPKLSTQNQFHVGAQSVSDGNQPEVTPPDIFKQRKDHVDKVCASKRVVGGIKGVYTDSKAGVVYCFVPKTGCTFWKQMFLFQYMKQTHSLKSPWNLTKLTVHTGNDYTAGAPFKANEHSSSHYPTRLLVTREPFSRLLSSYLDKVYLPDFWRYTGHYASRAYQNFIKMKSHDHVPQDFLRNHFDEMARRFEPGVMKAHNSTAYYFKSAKYLTFADFVRGSLGHSEAHWLPVHGVCNPCVFKPTHVSKMETLTADASVILEKMNMSRFIAGFDHKEQITKELKTIVDYNFQRWPVGPGSFMTGYPEFAFRLWSNFQWRGYIHPRVEYVVPQNTQATHVQEDLFRQIWKARQLGLQDPQATEEAKRKFKLNVFKTLDKGLFNAIVSKYSMDFSLFGYEENIDRMRKELFSS